MVNLMDSVSTKPKEERQKEIVMKELGLKGKYKVMESGSTKVDSNKELGMKESLLIIKCKK
jgi:hypothetical protein